MYISYIFYQYVSYIVIYMMGTSIRIICLLYINIKYTTSKKHDALTFMEDTVMESYRIKCNIKKL